MLQLTGANIGESRAACYWSPENLTAYDAGLVLPAFSMVLMLRFYRNASAFIYTILDGRCECLRRRRCWLTFTMTPGHCDVYAIQIMERLQRCNHYVNFFVEKLGRKCFHHEHDGRASASIICSVENMTVIGAVRAARTADDNIC